MIVVEHDTDTMLAADYLVDVGPAAGENGGQIIACGTPEEVINNENSITGRYLSGKECIEIPKTRRKGKNLHFATQRWRRYGILDRTLKRI